MSFWIGRQRLAPASDALSYIAATVGSDSGFPSVVSADLSRMAGSDQLCVGQSVGTESANHEFRRSFNASNEQCLLQVDADNTFNTLIRCLLLHSIEKICPLVKVVLLNMYRKDFSAYV